MQLEPHQRDIPDLDIGPSAVRRMAELTFDLLALNTNAMAVVKPLAVVLSVLAQHLNTRQRGIVARILRDEADVLEMKRRQ